MPDNKSIVKIQFGSHLYGTDTPQSDLDYKLVHLPDPTDILLQRASNSIKIGPEKSEGEKNAPGDVDSESYSLQYFLKLLADGQTVAIDMLFAPDTSIITGSDLWDYIRVNKSKFLSRKSAAFVGYCRQQANKYGIKGSRVAAVKQAWQFFYDMYQILPRSAKVEDTLSGMTEVTDNEHSAIVSQPIGSSGEQGNFFECCGRKVAFNAPLKSAVEIFGKIYENYGARARQAQSNEGVDWKALSHAVRVGGEALELLSTGKVTFPLPNANHIRDIKQGLISYGAVSEEIELLLEEVEEASLKSTLPAKADFKFIDTLVKDVYYTRVITRGNDG